MPFGKWPSGFMVNLDELERQMRLELIDDEPRAAVAGIHDNFQRLELRHINIGQQVLDVGGHDIDAMAHAGARCALGNSLALRKAANFLKTVIAADGLGLLAHELHAVVVGRIVAGGDHDAAVVATIEGREIHALGAAHADVVYIDAAVGQTAAHRIRETGAAQADIAADDDAPAARGTVR